ncbi:hypothetical protein Pcinc_004825 [Petrolisthes cinctipes]|uniref:C-type lectin domain-containing protein n=1 Tax=Petrolisthes cinctipes TaxID=88211 RepID=A0AAE1L3E3_PETCI|nr:hypothetical protein Pcinc_004825 [Petrolisthes cinctipes]
MTSSLKVAILILGLLCPCSADITHRDPSEINNERMSTMESEVQEELRHLREVVEEYTKLREDLITLKNFVYVGKFFHHEGKDFYMNREQKLSWTDSRRWCQVRGGDLAQPTGDLISFMQQVHQLFLPYVGSARHEGVWMGASDIASEGQWFWLSGTQLPNNFPWDGIEPNSSGGNEDCLEIICRRDGITFSYNDQRCMRLRYFVCEL